MTGDCASCKHSAAYHDGYRGRVCRAWNPDEDDNLCACSGWKKAAPAVFKPVESLPDKYWTE